MREFFKPWRRKIGFLALGLAVLLTAAWLRAYRDGSGDVIVYISQGIPSLGPNAHKELSCFGVASFERVLFLSVAEWAAWPSSSEWRQATLRWETYPTPNSILNIDEAKAYLRSSPGSWSALGTVFGSNVVEDFNFRVWGIIIPHFQVVIPLTLLSAWLLLSNPRPAKKSEPAVTEPDHA